MFEIFGIKENNKKKQHLSFGLYKTREHALEKINNLKEKKLDWKFIIK